MTDLSRWDILIHVGPGMKGQRNIGSYSRNFVSIGLNLFAKLYLKNNINKHDRRKLILKLQRGKSISLVLATNIIPYD